MHIINRALKVSIIAFLIISCGSNQEGLNSVIEPGTKPVKLNTNYTFDFTEGPVFDAEGNLYFTDGTNGKVYRMEISGRFTPVITVAGRPDGMMIDRSGNLVVCDYDAKRLDLYAPDGKFIKTLADSYNGKKLNGPNDIVLDKKGGIYFTDPFFRRPNAPQETEAVYYIPKGGTIQRAAADFTSPNGIIFTPDEKMLLVVDTQETHVHAYDVKSDGSLHNHRIWGNVTLPPYKQGKKKPRSGSVGVAMDEEGRLYVATDLGLEVFTAEGNSLGVIKMEEFKRPLNMTFDRKNPYTMIITAYESVYSLKMNTRGISFPQLD
ncbi:SMP-30/gluconolactonase/LRE family protein [bacterium]|nr:SMP-30/gluconolactonase/LRE family protein [bacterium]